MITKPVVIVGAGPIGLTAALELSRFGVPVRIVDRLATPATTSRAIALHARTLELLSQRGVGATMLELGNPATGVSFFGDGKRLGRVDLSNVPSRHNYTLMLSQAETERLLSERVAAQGVTVERGTEAIAFENRRDPTGGARVVLRDSTGTLEEVEAAYVIAAEGAHSTLRATAGLPFPGTSSPAQYALGDMFVDTEHPDTELPDTDMSIFIGRHGFVAMFPLGRRRFRIIVTEGPEATDAAPSLPELQGLYDAIATTPARLHDLQWSSRFVINSRMLPVLRAGNVFFGGDAAHIHSPAGGQGMNTGMGDMIDLCWKLAMVMRGLAGQKLLDTYSTERLAVIKSVVSTTERATDVLNADSPLMHRAITVGASILLGLDKVQTMAPRMISQTGADYRDSPVSVNQHPVGEVRAGDRIPDSAGTVAATVDGGGAKQMALYDLLDPTGFTLLVLGDAAPPDVEQRLAPWPVTVRRIATPTTEHDGAAAFGRVPGLILVRPDAYAAVTADHTGFDAVETWLRTWLPREEESS